MEAALEEEMKVLLQHETEKLRKKLSGAHADDPLFRYYSAFSMPAITTLKDLIRPTFMQMITEKPALRHLFLLAIYEGAYGADTLMPKFMEDHFPTQISGGAPEQAVFLQSQGMCIHKFAPFPASTHTYMYKHIVLPTLAILHIILLYAIR